MLSKEASNLSAHLNHLVNLFKWNTNSVGLGRDLKVCFSNSLPGDVDGAGSQITF